MPNKLSNQEIVQILKEVIAAMEVKGADRFRLRAYQNAISAIETSTYSVYDLWEKDRLKEIPGVGASLSQHISDLFEKGSVKDFDVFKKDLPQGMFSLIGLQGIGAKKAYKLAEAFSLENRETAIDEIIKYSKQGKIRVLPGFGEKSEKQILDSLEEQKKTKREKPRLLWSQGDEIVQRIYKYMRNLDSVLEIEALGSYRRKKETIGDLDIAVSTEDDFEAMEHFLKYPEIKEILVKGDKKVSVVLGNDLQVDFRVVSPNQFGSMIQYFTGSKYHNISLRTYAIEKGYSVSEYGIKRGNKLNEFSTEKDFYSFLNLQLIPPEIRQGKEEVEVARQNLIPDLISLSDIKGDIHTHTVFSDGENTLEEMVVAAKAKNYAYYGIADHAPSISSRGYEEVAKIINNTKKDIENINLANKDIKVLFGYEVNILADSTLGLPNELLEKLDFVIAAIHTSYSQPREKIMERYIYALNHPLVSVIAHPSGRLINERPQLDIDWMVLLEETAKAGKILEINSQPQRLDLPYDIVKEARDMGIKLIINSDAHNTNSLDYIQYGINVARRGWCVRDDIVNTLPKDEFLRILR